MVKEHNYCVVYKVCGMHYRYRCVTSSKQKAKSLCKKIMGKEVEIIEIYTEDNLY